VSDPDDLTMRLVSAALFISGCAWAQTGAASQAATWPMLPLMEVARELPRPGAATSA